MIKKYGSAREMLKAISDGEIPNQFVGVRSKEVLKQELFSVKNSWKSPSSGTAEEQEKQTLMLAEILQAICALPFKEQFRLSDEVDAMLHTDDDRLHPPKAKKGRPEPHHD